MAQQLCWNGIVLQWRNECQLLKWAVSTRTINYIHRDCILLSSLLWRRKKTWYIKSQDRYEKAFSSFCVEFWVKKKPCELSTESIAWKMTKFYAVVWRRNRVWYIYRSDDNFGHSTERKKRKKKQQKWNVDKKSGIYKFETRTLRLYPTKFFFVSAKITHKILTDSIHTLCSYLRRIAFRYTSFNWHAIQWSWLEFLVCT